MSSAHFVDCCRYIACNSQLSESFDYSIRPIWTTTKRTKPGKTFLIFSNKCETDLVAAYLHGSQLSEPQPGVQPGGGPGDLPAPDQRQHHHLRPNVTEQRGPPEGDAAPAPQQRGHPGQGAGGGARGRSQHGHPADTPPDRGRGGGRGTHHTVPAHQEERGDQRSVAGVSAGAGAVQQQSKKIQHRIIASDQLINWWSFRKRRNGGGFAAWSSAFVYSEGGMWQQCTLSVNC